MNTILSAETLQSLLTDRINNLDVCQARIDIERFIADPEPLEIWSRDYFAQISEKITCM